MATLERLAEIYFSSRVRKSCLSLVEFHVDCAVDAQSEVELLMEMNII